MKLLRRLALALLVLVAVVAVGLVGLATPPGRTLLARAVESIAASAGYAVAIDGLSGWPPFVFGAKRITVADGATQAPIAEIDGLALDFAPSRLLSGTIGIDSLTAGRVALLGLPPADPDAASGGGAPLIPPFALDRLAIDRLELAEAVPGGPAVLSLAGSAFARADRSFAADLTAQRRDGPAGDYRVTLRAEAGRLPTADIRLAEAADGILVRAMGQSGGPGYSLDLEAAPEGDRLAGTIALASDGEARFDGRFGFGPEGAGTRLLLQGDGSLAGLVPPQFAAFLAGALSIDIDASWAFHGGALPDITIARGRIESPALTLSAAGRLSPGSVGGQSSGAAPDLAVELALGRPDGAPLTLPLATPVSLTQATLRGSIGAAGDTPLRLDLVGHVAGLSVAGATIPGTGLSLALESGGPDPLAERRFPFALRIEADALRTDAATLAASETQPLLLTADGTLDLATLAAEADATLTAAGATLAFSGTAASGQCAPYLSQWERSERDSVPDEGQAAPDSNASLAEAFRRDATVPAPVAAPDCAAAAAPSLTGTLTAKIPDLAPLAPFAGRALAGAAEVTASGTFLGPQGTALDLAATTRDLDPGNTTAAALLAGPAELAAHLTADGETLAATGIRLSGTRLAATGEASLSDTVTATLSGSIADLAVLEPRSTGRADFTADISGALPWPTVTATLKIPEGRLAGQAVSDASLALSGQAVDRSDWRGSLDLSGSLAGKALDGTAQVTLAANGDVAFPTIDLAVAGNRITGALTPVAGGLLAGTLSLEAPDLAPLAALALTEAAGSASGTVAFAAEDGRQQVALRLKGSGLTVAALTARGIDASIDVADAFGAPRITGSASLSGAAAGATRLGDGKATASVAGDTTDFTLALAGGDITLDAAGRLAGGTLDLARAEGSAFGLPLGLAAPASIDLAASRLASPLRLNLDGGRATLTGAFGPELALEAVAENIPARLVNRFAPSLGAEGSLSARATISGPTSAPQIAWQLDWPAFRVAQTASAGLPALALSASGRATTSATSLDARLAGAGLALRVTGDVPFAGGRLAVHAEGDAPLSLLALESARELRLAGTARIAVDVAGALAAPAITGSATLAGATIIDSETGFGIRDAAGRLAFDGKRATVERLTGSLAQGGTAAVSGSIDVTAAGLPADLTVRVDNGRYADGNLIDTTFNANLAVKGPLLGDGLVSGTVALGRTQVRLPDSLGSTAAAIPVEHVNAAPGFQAPATQKPSADAGAGGASSGSGGLRLSIEISNSGGIFVRGFGIDSEFGGALRLTNRVADPVAEGAFTLQRGRLEIIGRRFELTAGTLTFSGDLVPIVDFTATTSTSDTTISVHVTGPASAPTISLSSSPDYNQEEILSRLLFDREVGALSPLQAAQLLDAAATLTGVIQGDGIFARIRETTGLDDLDIRENSSGDVTVGAGRRINDRIRLGVEASPDAGNSRVTIDLNLTDNLKARGEAGEDGSGKLGLTFEREY